MINQTWLGSRSESDFTTDISFSLRIVRVSGDTNHWNAMSCENTRSRKPLHAVKPDQYGWWQLSFYGKCLLFALRRLDHFEANSAGEEVSDGSGFKGEVFLAPTKPMFEYAFKSWFSW